MPRPNRSSSSAVARSRLSSGRSSDSSISSRGRVAVDLLVHVHEDGEPLDADQKALRAPFHRVDPAGEPRPPGPPRRDPPRGDPRAAVPEPRHEDPVPSELGPLDPDEPRLLRDGEVSAQEKELAGGRGLDRRGEGLLVFGSEQLDAAGDEGPAALADLDLAADVDPVTGDQDARVLDGTGERLEREGGQEEGRHGPPSPTSLSRSRRHSRARSTRGPKSIAQRGRTA